MAKADERAEVVKAEAEAEKVYQEGRGRQLAEGAEIPVLYGNENFVHDKPRGRAGRDAATPRHTQEEWLVEAGEVVAVMERGDAVSHETVKMLFLDAYDVIEGFTPPATRDSKKKDSDDEKRDEPHRRQEK